MYENIPQTAKKVDWLLIAVLGTVVPYSATTGD
jgi:hypothetical protein